jgi:hypothetical protein
MKEAAFYKITEEEFVISIDFKTSTEGMLLNYYIVQPYELIIPESNGISEIIMHLSEKAWVPGNLLYELASVIKKYDLRKRIDWLNTFTEVEKSSIMLSINKNVDELKEDEVGEFESNLDSYYGDFEIMNDNRLIEIARQNALKKLKQFRIK